MPLVRLLFVLFLVFFFDLLRLLEVKHHTVYTIAETSWRRAVVKYMTQVRFASSALYFGAIHSMGMIGRINDTALADRLIKTGPTAATLKFGIAPEQWIPADSTVIRSLLEKILVLAGPGPFRSLQTGYIIHVLW